MEIKELIDVTKHLSSYEIEYLNKVLLATKESSAFPQKITTLGTYTTLQRNYLTGKDSSKEALTKIQRIQEMDMLVKILSKEFEDKDIFSLGAYSDDFPSQFSDLSKKADALILNTDMNDAVEGVAKEQIVHAIAEQTEATAEDSLEILRQFVYGDKDLSKMLSSDIKKIKENIKIVDFKHLDDDTISAVSYFFLRKMAYIEQHNIPTSITSPFATTDKKTLTYLSFEYLSRHPLQIKDNIQDSANNSSSDLKDTTTNNATVGWEPGEDD